MPFAVGRVTSYDVARLAGVSQSAVSRCFKPGASISAETRAKVEAAARELGWAPNAFARSLITRRSGLIGVAVTDITMRNYPDLLFHLGGGLQAAGYKLLLVTLGEEEEIGASLRQLYEYPLEGIVSCVALTREQIATTVGRGVAVVLFNREPLDPVAAAVLCNHADAMRQLTDRLHDAGYRRFAGIGGPTGAPVGEARLLGLRSRLRELGLPLTVRHADYSYDGGRAAARALLADPTRPDVIVATNDAMALGAMDACRHELGLAVPTDVAVTGFDDIAEAARPAYALTTLRQPVRAMTQAVLELLHERLEGRRADGERRLVPARLVIRASARVAPEAPDPTR